jgi:hypothetical protein
MCALALATASTIAEPVSAQKAAPVNAQENAQEKPHAAQESPIDADPPDPERQSVSASRPDFARSLARPDGSMPLLHDWSNRHVIYTAGYTAEQAGRMAKDPRAYAAFADHGIVRRRHEPIRHAPNGPHLVHENMTMQRDWAVSLGAGIVQVTEAMFPAKYTFDVNAPPSCTNDFVVFPVAPSFTGSSRAKVLGTFTDDPTTGQTTSITITPAGSSPVTLTLTAGATNLGTTFALSGTNNTTTDAANLAAAINRNLSSVGLDEIAAIAGGANVKVFALTAGTRITMSVANGLTNFSWGSVTAGANGAQANIVGLNELYAGSGSPFCAGFTYPTFTFSYAAGVGPVFSSPVLSLSGQKIAFVEDDLSEGYGAILHILTLGTGTEYGACTNSGTATPTCGTAAVIPGSTSGSNATDFMVPLAPVSDLSPADDHYSSPFVDYVNDVLYVGDDNGNLYSISPVFGGGTPALRSGFPIVIDGPLGSPVVDVGNTGNVFVLSEGAQTRLYNISSGGGVAGYIALGYDDLQFDDGPIVDSTNEVGYAAAGCNDGNGLGNSILDQFSIAAVGNPELLATANLSAAQCTSGLAIFSPTPDQNYFTAGISSSTPGDNGELLVANDGTSNSDLAQFQFTSGIMSTTAEYTDTDGGGFGSGHTFLPLTEFYGDDQAYAIGTVAQSGNTVTVTTAANAFVSSQAVVISGIGAGTGGCTGSAANAIDGEQAIVVTSSTTFTFTSAANATIGGANGSCTLTSALATGPTQDYLFFATTQPEVFAFDLPLASAAQSAAATNATSVELSTGGIIVDNDSDDGQASSIYFVTSETCGAGACAVKLTQAGLD